MAGSFRMNRIFNLTSGLMVAHCVFFYWALKEHPGWLQGGEFNLSVIAYPVPWISIIGIEMVTNLTSGAERIVFFVVGLLQWYAVGSYFDGFAKRVT